MPDSLTLLDGADVLTLAAQVEAGRVRVSEDAVRDDLGWSLEAQGLCQGNVCVPVRDREALVSESGLDLEVLADLLDRPLALEAESGVAALGVAAGERAKALAGGEAPDFTLPDLEGQLHSLSDHRGKKVLLIAYASW